MNNNEHFQLLRFETNLPANILDVQYYQTFEFGLLEYIVVQNDMFDDINYYVTLLLSIYVTVWLSLSTIGCG